MDALIPMPTSSSATGTMTPSQHSIAHITLSFYELVLLTFPGDSFTNADPHGKRTSLLLYYAKTSEHGGADYDSHWKRGAVPDSMEILWVHIMERAQRPESL